MNCRLIRDVANALVLGLLLSAAVAPGNLHASTEPQYAAVEQVLEKFIEHEMADQELPALSIAVVDDQQVVWVKGFGYAQPKSKVPATGETVYRAGSVSQLFTDVAIMQLVGQGKLDLDAPVTRYLPDFHPDNPFDKPVTLRELMSHRAGLVREPPVGSSFDGSGPSLAQTVASLNKTRLVYRPGSRTKYSNAGIAMIGYVLERTQHEPFAQYVQRRVLGPLGLGHSSFEATPEVATGTMWTVDGRVLEAPTFQLGIAPAAGLYTTAGDLGHFLSALFAGGRAVKSATAVAFHFGQLQGRRQAGLDGTIAGFATTLEALPDDKLGVVVITTKDAANGVTSHIADLALKAMLAARQNKPLPQSEITSPLDPGLVRRIAGRYMRGDRGFDLTESAGTLSLLATDGGMPARIRSMGDVLVVDGPLSYGKKILLRGNDIVIDGETFKRVSIAKPPEPPARWTGLIGEYGEDYDILYILEKDQKLWALIDWFEFDPLEQVSANVYRFPHRGLYDGERLVFTRDAKGRATAVNVSSVLFQRRKVGPEEGATQLRITPLRPVAELLREAIAAEPPKESGDFRKPDLVELTALDPSIKLEIRYATTNNFLGTVFYSQARAFMQRPAAEAVVRAHHELRKRGYGLLIHDAYRPWYVTRMFWDATPDDKKIFVANPSEGSRHNRGCAVDLTLYDLKSGKPVQMVSTYDETTDRAYADYPGGTSLQRWQRHVLREAMEAEGFTVYPAEWWHFDYKDWRSYPIMNVRFENIGRQQ